jgi:hypothetical protein
MKRFKQVLLVVLVMFVLSLFYGVSVENFSFPFLAKPHLTDGDTIYIKTIDGKYITSCAACFPNDANIDNRCKKTLCLKDVPYITSQFIYHRHRDGTFSLETAHGKYWKRCSECIQNCPHVICSDGINPNLQTHKFVLIKNRDNIDSISIKTDNGRLLEVTDCDQSCGKVVTALGLNASNTFVLERVIAPVITPHKKPELKKVSFDKLLPREFPGQWPYSQS